jgi:integrase
MTRAKGTGSIFKPKGSSFYWTPTSRPENGTMRPPKAQSSRWRKTCSWIDSGAISHGLDVTPKMGKKLFGAGLKAVIENLTMNGRKDVEGTQQRIDKHLLRHVAIDDVPAGGHFSSDRRMSTITTADIDSYKAARLREDAQPATVNRELAIIRRAFKLAIQGGELVAMPYIGLLRENNVRTGFFERQEFDAILRHLPTRLHPPLEFMYLTGWRKSEVFSLTVSQVDLAARTVKLEVGTTKSGQGRTFMLAESLHALLTKQLAAIKALKKRGKICPWVFHYEDGTQIKDLREAWDKAREAAVPTSSSTISDGRLSGTSNGRRCPARQRWRWWAIGQKPSTGATRSRTRRCSGRRRPSSKHGRQVRLPEGVDKKASSGVSRVERYVELDR